MKNKGTIIWGFILLALGIIWGGNTLNLFDINIFFDGWWTLFIIIPCFIGLFNDEDKEGSLIGITIGVFLLLACQDIIDFDLVWKLLFPTILIIIGLSLIFKNIFKKEVNKNIKKLNEKLNKDDSNCATFSGQNIDMAGEEFHGKELNAIFGGIKLDLTKAVIKEDVVINATSIFGGIDILVPKDVKVKVKSNSIFGGVDNKIKNSENEKGYTIYVNATCLFGGVDIK